ncbi:MAG: hemerythrin domain-containing protein [Novosphingobium sp.]|uniref:hemerythrin domain-containing protein n=1 Tax=Novosphingobium sp. TaxID=1874826 RepID=UPI003B9AD459
MASQAGTRPNQQAARNEAANKSSKSGASEEEKRQANTGKSAGGRAEKRDPKNSGSEKGTGASKSAIESLKADHRKAEQLFARFETADDEEKQVLIKQVCNALTLHTMLEEEVFYPACRDKMSESDPLNEAQVEHDSAKLLIADLMALQEDDPFRDAKVKVLAEQIKHHVWEEEDGKDSIFAKAEAKGVDTPELAHRLQQRRAELEQRDALPGGKPVAINLRTVNQKKEEHETASYQQRGHERDDDGGARRDSGSRGERDEDGRFTSSRSGSGHGGWYGDSRGHSQAARKGWDNRD